MERLLLEALRGLPEFRQVCSAVDRNAVVGVSGAAQINRTHLIAAICHETRRPAVIVCQDELAVRRTQMELSAFLDTEGTVLPSRDFTFHSASAISRGWEQ